MKKDNLQSRTSKRKKDYLLLVLLLFFCVSVTGCTPYKEASQPEINKVTIAYSPTMISVLVHIAYTRGYFRDEGLQVTPQFHEFGKLALDAMLEGKADLAVSADMPIVHAVANGKKLFILADICVSPKAIGIVALKERGITNPQHIRGKRIGVVFGTMGEFLLDYFLIMNEIKRNEVKIIDMKPSEMHNALTAGRVDAVCIWNPHKITLERALKDRVVVFYDENHRGDVGILSAPQEFVQKYPETVKRILKALVRAEDYARNHPEEAKNITAELNKIDRPFIDAIWDDYRLRVMLEQSLIVALEEETRWLAENGLMKRVHMPNYLAFIYTEGLHAVKPEGVSIIRKEVIR